MTRIGSSPSPRAHNDDGQIRRVRADAQIGNVRSIRDHAPDLIEGLGASTRVGELRATFGGKDVSEIVALPKAQRAVAIQEHLASLGLDNHAAAASMTAALLGGLGDKVLESDGYYVQIGGKKLDRELLQGFIASLAGPHDHVVSAGEAKAKIVPAMIDGNGMTAVETETYLFAMQHLPVSDKALREALIPALREATGAPVIHLGPGQAGFDFMQLYAHLEHIGRLQDLYSAKTDMSSAEMLAMWDNKLSLADLNAHLEKSLQPKSYAALEAQFGKDAVAGVQSWLKAEGEVATLKRLAGGKMSPGELQNLVYGSWQLEHTPYDADYAAKFAPIPVTTPAGKALGDFAAGVEKQIAAHDWKGLLTRFDADNRATQASLGIGDAQYIAEGLGLHTVDNSLPGDITQLSTLDQIASVQLGRALGPSGELTGTATLKDGSTLAVSIPLSAQGKSFEITPAVG